MLNRLALGTLRKMSVFTQKLNPINGCMEWCMQDEKYDYHQEIARSAYADMLHDTERNQKYYQSLRKTICRLKDEGKAVHVLDIGTGTGLLSMMAVKCGADTVTACEAFEPIAKCAQDVIKANGFENKIKLIAKRSTDVTVGLTGDMPLKANVLVTELFDTELIGEGAIPTFIHAHQHLLEPNCCVIPCEATVFSQVIESELLWRWHHFYPIKLPNGKTIVTPQEINKCEGAAAVHDCQLSQLFPSVHFKTLTEPLPVLKFDFSGKTKLKRNRFESRKIRAIHGGVGHIVFMWWELKMDSDGEIMLSCAPKWQHPDGLNAQWRDHWMQAVYFLPRSVPIEFDQQLTMHSAHDEFSLWFNVELDNDVIEKDDKRQANGENSICTCGAHVAFSRSRIGMMNDVTRQEKYINTLKKIITPDSICLCVGDGSLLPMIVGKLGAKKVFSMDSEPLSRKVMESFVSANKLDNSVLVLPLPAQNVFGNNILGSKADVFVGEPFFMNSVLPWDNIRFWYLRTTFSLALSEDVRVVPEAAVIKAAAVEFTDLWKIKVPVGVVEGFNINNFDQLISSSSEISDDPVEPHPLWEYPGVALTESWQLINFSFVKKINLQRKDDKVEKTGKIEFAADGTCNAIALWMDWNLDESNIISSGPTKAIKPGELITWDKYSRQGVYFFPHPIQQVKSKPERFIEYRTTFYPHSGQLDFKFEVL